MIRILFLLILSITISCSNDKYQVQERSYINTYPRIIDSLGIQEIYDYYLRRLYLKAIFKYPTEGNLWTDTTPLFSPKVYWYSIAQEFDGYVKKGDAYWFYFKNEVPQNVHYDDSIVRETYINYEHGFIYRQGDDTITFLYNRGGKTYEEIMARYDNVFFDTARGVTMADYIRYFPYHDTVIKELNKQKDKLTPWLYNECLKRGFFYDTTVSR